LLLANARCPSFSHHDPDLATLILSSERLEREIIAERRTPPTTTISPILQRMSWHSRELSLRPTAPLNLLMTNLNKSSRGPGPEALPPNVLSLAPAGRTLETSHLGTSPE